MSLIYAAERDMDQGRELSSLSDVQDYLDRLTATDWWPQRFPQVARVEAVRIRSTAVDGVGRPEHYRAAGIIGLTREGQREMTILHEVAHSVCDSDEGHGAIWARTFLELVYRTRGAEYWSALRASFLEKEVDIG